MPKYAAILVVLGVLCILAGALPGEAAILEDHHCVAFGGPPIGVNPDCLCEGAPPGTSPFTCEKAVTDQYDYDCQDDDALDCVYDSAADCGKKYVCPGNCSPLNQGMCSPHISNLPCGRTYFKCTI